MPEQIDHGLDRCRVRLVLANPTQVLLDEIAEGATRDAVALTWSIAPSRELDWYRVRRAVVARWSVSGLRYIERRADALRIERRTRRARA